MGFIVWTLWLETKGWGLIRSKSGVSALSLLGVSHWAGNSGVSLGLIIFFKVSWACHSLRPYGDGSVKTGLLKFVILLTFILMIFPFGCLEESN